ncbi:hypothetical protein [Rhodovulum sp. 12E13]|uniref:hypothetical protein n=1 Tax=Rhodovulum sp. 12E13 TaxID=2203891 RepID=UPI001314113C|nr:hypothetical protein [Rhodovulum sp. 12E13]
MTTDFLGATRPLARAMLVTLAAMRPCAARNRRGTAGCAYTGAHTGDVTVCGGGGD